MRDGMIIAVGDRRDARAWRAPRTEVIDLGNAPPSPRVWSTATSTRCSGWTSPTASTCPASAPSRARRRAARGPLEKADTGWLLGWGLDPNAFGGAPITSTPLVEAVGDVPALIVLFDAHSAIASPAALRPAGITGPRSSTAPPRSSATSRATDRPPAGTPGVRAGAAVLPAEPARVRRGPLLETAHRHGRDRSHRRQRDGLRRRLARTGRHARRGGRPADAAAVRAVLHARRRARPSLDHIIDQQRLRGRRWQVEGVKFMIDGTIDGGTAWLEQPDTSRRVHRAVLARTRRVLPQAARYLADRGVPTVTHAIGDAGHPLRARRAEPTCPASRTGSGAAPDRAHRDRSRPTGRSVPRRRTSPPACSPPTAPSTPGPIRATTGRAGSAPSAPIEHSGRRDLRDAGARLALGSDWPVAPFDPRGVLADAQLRRPHGHPTPPRRAGPGADRAAWRWRDTPRTRRGRPGSAMSRAGSRWGSRADLSALHLDPLAAPPDEFAESGCR